MREKVGKSIHFFFNDLWVWREYTFRKNTRGSDYFYQLRCQKNARRCGAKYISKSDYTKHFMFTPLLEVRMSKKCTPLRHETHFECKILKILEIRTTSENSDVASHRFASLHCIILHYTTIHYTPLQLQLHHCTPAHSTALHYTELLYTTLHYTTLHCATLHYLPLHSTTPHRHNYTPRH